MMRLLLGMLDVLYTLLLIGVLLTYELPILAIGFVLGGAVLGFYEGIYWTETRRGR